MNKKNFRTYSLYFVAAVTLAVWALLLWDFTHGGVPSHHILANENYPAISNWWGGLTVPLLCCLLVYRIYSRLFKNTAEENQDMQWRQIRNGFFIGLLFAVILSIFFSLNYADVPLYMLFVLLIASLFTPIYRAECFLGFVLGMVYTFGGVLPLLVGSVFSIIGILFYKGIRPIILYIIKKASV